MSLLHPQNLELRCFLEAIVAGYQGNRDSQTFKDFMAYVKEVWFKRWKGLNIAPQREVLNPKLVPIHNKKGEIIDIKVAYPPSFKDQMMEYARDYSFLPTYSHLPKFSSKMEL